MDVAVAVTEHHVRLVAREPRRVAGHIDEAVGFLAVLIDRLLALLLLAACTARPSRAAAGAIIARRSAQAVTLAAAVSVDKLVRTGLFIGLRAPNPLIRPVR